MNSFNVMIDVDTTGLELRSDAEILGEHCGHEGTHAMQSIPHPARGEATVLRGQKPRKQPMVEHQSAREVCA